MSWRIFDSHSDFFSVNYAALSHTAFYARTFYWALSALSGIGFPDMLAKNPIEMCVISVIMLFGAIGFGALIGAIATLMSSFGREKREFNAKVSRVQELVKYKNVPAEIESKLSRYYEYMWTRYGGVNESEVLATLPKSLRAVVASHVMGPFLARIPFFRCCSEPMEKVIVAMFSPRVFLHDDALMIFGEVGKEMFIIESGEVKVTSADKKITFATLKSGTYIGESCLLDLTKRTASVYAVNYVDTYFLTSENFLKVSNGCVLAFSSAHVLTFSSLLLSRTGM
jgi:CRP-like cAMP-binding protein